MLQFWDSTTKQICNSEVESCDEAMNLESGILWFWNSTIKYICPITIDIVVGLLLHIQNFAKT